jgi:hypothetical protein
MIDSSTARPTSAPDRDRVYPKPRENDDARFTSGLMFDIMSVLECHEYQRPAGIDYGELQHALFTFLCGPTTRCRRSDDRPGRATDTTLRSAPAHDPRHVPGSCWCRWLLQPPCQQGWVATSCLIRT